MTHKDNIPKPGQTRAEMYAEREEEKLKEEAARFEVWYSERRATEIAAEVAEKAARLARIATSTTVAPSTTTSYTTTSTTTTPWEFDLSPIPDFMGLARPASNTSSTLQSAAEGVEDNDFRDAIIVLIISGIFPLCMMAVGVWFGYNLRL